MCGRWQSGGSRTSLGRLASNHFLSYRQGCDRDRLPALSSSKPATADVRTGMTSQCKPLRYVRWLLLGAKSTSRASLLVATWSRYLYHHNACHGPRSSSFLLRSLRLLSYLSSALCQLCFPLPRGHSDSGSARDGTDAVRGVIKLKSLNSDHLLNRASFLLPPSPTNSVP